MAIATTTDFNLLFKQAVWGFCDLNAGKPIETIKKNGKLGLKCDKKTSRKNLF